MKGLNIVSPNGKINPMALALEKMKADMTAMLEYSALRAKMHKHKYDCLRQEGFNEKEALELCKEVP